MYADLSVHAGLRAPRSRRTLARMEGAAPFSGFELACARAAEQAAFARAQRAQTIEQRERARRWFSAVFSQHFAADDFVTTKPSYRNEGVVTTSVSDVASVVEESLSRSVIVGRNITLGRMLLRWTQAHLAEQVDKRPNHVSDWERGKHEPKAEHIALLADTLGQSEHWFYVRHDAEWDERGI